MEARRRHLKRDGDRDLPCDYLVTVTVSCVRAIVRHVVRAGCGVTPVRRVVASCGACVWVSEL